MDGTAAAASAVGRCTAEGIAAAEGRERSCSLSRASFPREDRRKGEGRGEDESWERREGELGQGRGSRRVAVEAEAKFTEFREGWE